MKWYNQQKQDSSSLFDEASNALSKCIAIKMFFRKRLSKTIDAVPEKHGFDHDCFLKNPPKKPKAEIADYVESCGIMVPRRYAGIKEALDSGEDFIMRSEHPYEYSGIGGLLNSYEFRNPANYQNENFRSYIEKLLENEEAEMTEDEEKGICGDGYGVFYKLIRQFRNGRIDEGVFETKMKLTSMKQAKRFAKLSGISVEAFLDEMGFSYWKLIPGYNRMMIEDDGVSGRYHIITNGGKKWYYRNYSIYENGMILPNEVSELEPELKESISRDISFYEKIRRLPYFEDTNCPIIEFQTDLDGKNHFLQTHYGRNKRGSGFTLDRLPEKGEVEVEFIRGATPPEGMTGKISVTYHYLGIDEKVEELGCNDTNDDMIYSGFRDKRKRIGLIQGSIERIRYGITCHTKINQLFGPEVTAVLDIDGLIGEDRRSLLNRISREKKVYICLNFRLISDGRKGYLKLLDDIDEVIKKYTAGL